MIANGSSLAAQAVAGGLRAVAVWLSNSSVIAWLICLACLVPAVVRLLRLRGRYLDPIWALVFLLATNRLLYLSHVSPDLSRGTAIALALTMAGFSTWYQRHDR